MKKIILLLFWSFAISFAGVGQTTVFTDDFSANTSTAWTTGGAIGSSAWSVTRSGNDWGARRNVSPLQLELTNDVGTTGNANGWVFSSVVTGSFGSPYNNTLNLNSGLVTWLFNMRQIRPDPSGFGTNSYGVAFILGGTSTTANNTGTGYAVALGQGGTTDPIRLVKFANGMQGTLTNIIISNTPGLTDFGAEYLSIKVTYNPSNDQWELFLRNDGASAFADPAAGTLTSQGTATDNTYTSVSLTSAGGYWQGSTGASQPAFFDNVTVIVTPAGTPAITAGSITTFGNQNINTTSAEKSYLVSGTNLTGNITVTPPAGFEISTTSGSGFVANPSALTLTQSGGSVSATIYVRFAPTLLQVYSGNITHESTGALTENVAVSGNGVQNYYSASTGNLELTSSWGVNTDGTGSSPTSFTTDCQVFNIRNNASPTIGAAWAVSGAASKVILGDGTNAVNFTVPSANAFSGTVDLSAGSTITLQNSTIPAFGSIDPASTVVYDGPADQIITQTIYGNLTLSSAGVKTFTGNVTTVSGNLVFNNTTLNAPLFSPFATLSLGGNLTYQGTVTPPGDANSITLITTGTGTQTIIGAGNTARWFRLQTTYSGNNVFLSDIGGSTNLKVGNSSGGGISLANGSQLTLNGNTLEFFAGNVTVIGTGTITGSSSSSIIINKSGNAVFGTMLLTPGSETLNNLTLNLSGTINAAYKVTLGSPLTVNGMLTLSSGFILSGGTNLLTYGPAGILKYDGSIYTSTSDTVFPASNGPHSVIIQSASASGLSLHANRTIDGDLTIANGQIFSIPVAVQLTVSGILTNNAGSTGLVINSDATGTGSLLQNNAGVYASFKRYIPQWSDDAHGWHFLSSPVQSQPIQPEFVPGTVPIGTSQDFYSWDEINGQWFNSKDLTGNWVSVFETNFEPGKGYLTAYQNDVTKTFSGELTAYDVPRPSLTYTPGPNYTGDITPGWNLLGNPYSCAITWFSGWSTSNIDGVAKIWKESTASYIDVNAGGIIPATQGFMVQVLSASGESLTIPLTARTHDAQPWYKLSGNPTIKLIAHNPGAKTAQESVVYFNTQALTGFDPGFDSHFLPGYAPAFYSLKGNDKLSTKVLPVLDGETTVPFSFVKTAGSEFSIEAAQIENFAGQVYLTDLKLDYTQNLNENPVYNFTAADGDDPARFLLSFGHVGIGEKSRDNPVIYTYENNLYLVNPGNARLEVFSLTGQQLLISEINNPGLHKVTLGFPTGYYVVRLTTGAKVVVTKVFIQS